MSKTFKVSGQLVTVYSTSDMMPIDAVPIVVGSDIVAYVDLIRVVLGPNAGHLDGHRMCEAAKRFTGLKLKGWFSFSPGVDAIRMREV